MIVSFDGRREHSSGGTPNNPVRWTGSILVADADGNTLEHNWTPAGAPPMSYQAVRTAANQLVDSLKARLFEKYMKPIRIVTYTLTSR